MRGLESFVDIKGEAALSGASASVVEANVYVLFKLPAVANAVVGKQVPERFSVVEHISHSYPGYKSIAPPHMLA